MKIHAICLNDVGPYRGRHDFNLRDDWKGGDYRLVLFSGPNGTGKSTIMRAIAHLWQMAGEWLSTPDRRPTGKSQSRFWLRENSDAVAILLDDVPGIEAGVGIYFGDPDFFTLIQSQATFWMGEVTESRQNSGRSHLIHSENLEWMRPWSQAFKVLSLSFEPSSENGIRTPNIIYLDGEERHWVRPRGNPGQPIPDDPTKRWLVTYRPTQEWQGQLESSLITLKTLDEPHYLRVLADLNSFLVGKEIVKQPSPDLRLWVQAASDKDDGLYHRLDDLSAGERQVLIQIYLISRWLQPGGVVLLDEPDLHLHPSLVDQFLARVDAIVAERKGQLILASHLRLVWDYCEARGVRIDLAKGGKR